LFQLPLHPPHHHQGSVQGSGQVAERGRVDPTVDEPDTLEVDVTSCLLARCRQLAPGTEQGARGAHLAVGEWQLGERAYPPAVQSGIGRLKGACSAVHGLGASRSIARRRSPSALLEQRDRGLRRPRDLPGRVRN
jgi:hypothetical protein